MPDPSPREPVVKKVPNWMQKIMFVMCVTSIIERLVLQKFGQFLVQELYVHLSYQ